MPYWKWNADSKTNEQTARQYEAEYWCGTYDRETWKYTDDVPQGRRCKVRRLMGERITSLPGATYTHKEFDWEDLTSEEIINTVFDKENSDLTTRREQAAVMYAAGYRGPVSGGEARGLKNLFADLGLPDNVRRGHVNHKWKALSARSWRGEQTFHKLQACYVFKSPSPDIPFEKFIKLARLYRSDKGGIKAAVKAVLANPDAHKEIEACDAIDALAKLTGM
jgi:hypothetical protein